MTNSPASPASTASARRRVGQAEPTGRRGDVLATLRASAGPLGASQIAERLGVHPNTVRFHLDTLVRREQVERVRATRTGPGRPALLFRTPGGMDPAGPRNYRLLAEVLIAGLADSPDSAGKATEAGRDWGRQLAARPAPARTSDDGVEGEDQEGEEERAVGRLMGVLDELGFAPERQPSSHGGHIGLRHCPFLDLVPDRGAVVCPVHLGLMQGAMSAMGSSVTVERLEPFVRPDLCVARLGAAEAAEAAEEARP